VEARAVTFLRERPRIFRQMLTTGQREPALGAEPALRALLDDALSSARATDAASKHLAGTRASKQLLTERERAIIEFIAGGQSNKQIARTLGVTPETIKTHVKRIFIKLSAESRAQAVVRAQSLGFLSTVQMH
jgi:LuxR family transcriptional regulator, maltose regulon positive regulatory protein